MAKQGMHLTEAQKKRIIQLLTDTDMSLSDIAARTHCSRSTVAALNRKTGVRYYAGKRSTWSAVPQIKIEFIKTELNLARTFAEVAMTDYEMGDYKNAQRVHEKALKACMTAEKALNESGGTDEDIHRLKDLFHDVSAVLQRLPNLAA
jgi:hypothetical protein